MKSIQKRLSNSKPGCQTMLPTASLSVNKNGATWQEWLIAFGGVTDQTPEKVWSKSLQIHDNHITFQQIHETSTAASLSVNNNGATWQEWLIAFGGVPPIKRQKKCDQSRFRSMTITSLFNKFMKLQLRKSKQFYSVLQLSQCSLSKYYTCREWKTS